MIYLFLTSYSCLFKQLLITNFVDKFLLVTEHFPFDRNQVYLDMNSLGISSLFPSSTSVFFKQTFRGETVKIYSNAW